MYAALAIDLVSPRVASNGSDSSRRYGTSRANEKRGIHSDLYQRRN
jgi:hypothetical protein